MAQLQLRPLGVGEIIDATVTLYRRRFGPMMMIALIWGVIPFAITLFGDCTVRSTQDIACGNFLGWIGLPLFWIMITAATFASYLIAAGAYTDLAFDRRRAARLAIGKIVPIVAATIVFYIVAGIGFVLLIVPGIIMVVSLGMYGPALMVERVGPMASLGRSWRLVSGERWRLFLAGLLMLIISIIVFGIIGLVLYFLIAGLFGASDGFASYLSRQIVTLLTIPMSAAFATVVYLDLRVRKEGLDKEGLAVQLSGGN